MFYTRLPLCMISFLALFMNFIGLPGFFNVRMRLIGTNTIEFSNAAYIYLCQSGVTFINKNIYILALKEELGRHITRNTQTMNSYQMNLNVPTAHSLYPRATEKGTDKLYPSIKILVLPKYFDKLEFRLLSIIIITKGGITTET